MPRPLPQKSRVSGHVGVTVMDQRPDLAVVIAKIATTWSRVDERIGHIIVQMMRAEASIAMTMYQALSSSAAQLAVLRALARELLDKPMQDRLEGLLKKVKTARGKRNDVVHGHWHLSPEHPDELVWIDSKDDLLGYSEFWAGYTGAESKEKRTEFLMSYEGRKQKYLLYNKQELTDILTEIIRVGASVSTFNVDLENLNEASRDQTGVGRV